MSNILGLDTSNYTTSAALYTPSTGRVFQKKKLLPVKKGEVGLRQSEAVFFHIRQISDVLEGLFSLQPAALLAVGASAFPRDRPGSYMPCFLVGKSLGKSIALSGGVPFFSFSHQAGHVMAALYSCGQTALLKADFLAFHASGGTTELLHVSPQKEKGMSMRIVGKTMDLNAGQVVDRVGRLLGLPFPAGPAMEALADGALMDSKGRSFSRPILKGGDCCLSGVENQCAALLKKGAFKEEVARFCLSILAYVFLGMVETAWISEGTLPVVFAGGVLGNQLIRSFLEERLLKKGPVYFAAPAYSSDNAVGIALLAALQMGEYDG